MKRCGRSLPLRACTPRQKRPTCASASKKETGERNPPLSFLDCRFEGRSVISLRPRQRPRTAAREDSPPSPPPRVRAASPSPPPRLREEGDGRRAGGRRAPTDGALVAGFFFPIDRAAGPPKKPYLHKRPAEHRGHQPKDAPESHGSPWHARQDAGRPRKQSVGHGQARAARAAIAAQNLPACAPFSRGFGRADHFIDAHPPSHFLETKQALLETQHRRGHI